MQSSHKMDGVTSVSFPQSIIKIHFVQQPQVNASPPPMTDLTQPILSYLNLAKVNKTSLNPLLEKSHNNENIYYYNYAMRRNYAITSPIIPILHISTYIITNKTYRNSKTAAAKQQWRYAFQPYPPSRNSVDDTA